MKIWLLLIQGFVITADYLHLFFPLCVYSQAHTISGKIVDEATNEPINNVTVHLINLTSMTVSKEDGSFSITTSKWEDSLEVNKCWFERLIYPLQKNHTKGLVLKMKTSATRSTGSCDHGSRKR